MGRPAASADVQPSGRSRFERRSHTAPEPAVHRPSRNRVFHVSYSRQVRASTTMAWRSPSAFHPPSIRVARLNG